MTGIRRPITWTSTPTDTGRVEYDVDRVGAFTLGYCSSAYAGYDDQARLEVGFGRWRADTHPGRAGVLPEAPTINTITLIGGTSIDPDHALAFLTDQDDWAGWITVHRSEHGHTVHAPWATAARTAYIVARLVQDFLERPDAPDLLATHRRHCAPHRAAAHRDHLTGVLEELTEWRARQATEEQLLAIQEAILADTPPPPRPEPPPWRDYQRAATRGGEAFLLGTLGATHPSRRR